MVLVKWAQMLLSIYIGKDSKLLVFKSGMVVCIIEMVLILTGLKNTIRSTDQFMDLKIMWTRMTFGTENAMFWY